MTFARVKDSTIAVTATPPTYLPEHFAWNLKETMDIKTTEDERNLILGLNLPCLCVARRQVLCIKAVPGKDAAIMINV